MSTKKHIDRLFQEKLQDFEATPSDAVWENINAELSREKKSRKATPLWWKIAGIAAGIILLITVTNSVFFNNDESSLPENEIVDTKKDVESKNPEKLDQNEAVDLNKLTEEGSIASEDELNSSQDDANGNPANASENKTNEASNKLTSSTLNDKNATVASHSQGENRNHRNLQNKDAVINKNGVSTQNKVDAVSENRNNDRLEETNDNKENNSPILEKEKANHLIKSTSDSKDVNAVANVNSAENDTTKSETETETKTEEKTSLLEELEKLEEDKEVLDSDEKKKRWSVAPNIAPVYFNSFGSGSSIDSKFNNNDKSGEINMSYGVAANYEVNDKLSIRAGVNQVKLGYQINNVIVYNNVEPADNGKPLRNVALNDASQNLSFLSGDGLSIGQVPDVVADNISSSIDQRLGFIEIPVEAEYKLSDSKFGVSLIGGFSTLFLNENEVYSTLQDERQLLGEATNVNKTSFSANLGVGLKYKVSEKINLNLEPVFKYQLNTFSDTSGSFNPYTIGVYTGFSFKF